MTDKIEVAATIVVEIERGETGLWYARSRMVKGLLVAERTREACVAAVPRALADLAAVMRETDPPAR